MNNIFNTKCSKGSVKAELIKTENSFRQVLVGIIVNENYKISYLIPVKYLTLRNLLPLSIIIYFERIALMLFLSTRMADFANFNSLWRKLSMKAKSWMYVKFLRQHRFVSGMVVSILELTTYNLIITRIFSCYFSMYVYKFMPKYFVV